MLIHNRKWKSGKNVLSIHIVTIYLSKWLTNNYTKNEKSLHIRSKGELQQTKIRIPRPDNALGCVKADWQ